MLFSEEHEHLKEGDRVWSIPKNYVKAPPKLAIITKSFTGRLMISDGYHYVEDCLFGEVVPYPDTVELQLPEE